MKLSVVDLNDLAQRSDEERAVYAARQKAIFGMHLLIVARHGEFSPHRELPGGTLTSQGERDIESLAFQLRAFLPPDASPAVHCSVSNRSVESAQMLAGIVGSMPPQQTLRLGDERGNVSRDWWVDETLELLVESSRNRTTIILMTHETVIRRINEWLCNTLGMNEEMLLRDGVRPAHAVLFDIGNASATQFEP